MNYLSVENLSKTFGDKALFSNISFGIEQGQKVALIAKNGSGKSTLLKCIIGKEIADEGQVVLRNDIKVSFMEQEEDLNENYSIIEHLFEQDLPKINAIQAYQTALNSNDNQLISDASEKMSQFDAWDIESKIKQILSILKLNDWDKKIKHLSGGQKKRLSLAKVLLHEADLILLDEPTNHLDLDMIEWLEDYLSKSQCTLFMVTHDRYFLEVVCDNIYELDRKQIYKYKGSFSYYLEKKAEREEQLLSTIEKAKNKFRKELEWIRRQPKARSTKQKARIESFQVIKSTAKQSIEKDELEIPIKMERLGTKIVELHKISKRYNDLFLLDSFTYNFQRKERLGIVGNNGTGKSTFLQIIQQLTLPDSGKVIIGETVKFGYYSQDSITVKEDKKVIEVIKDIAEFIPLEKGRELSAAQLLEKFLFPREMHYQLVSKLSGGEKRRLKLLTVLIKNPNFLILDEPTNDLDIFVLSVLEEYLQSFPGCLIVVSHDRYFMDKMVDHLFVFEGNGKINNIIGNYTDYRKSQKNNYNEQVKTNKELEIVKENTNSKRKISFKEKKEMEELELTLENLEHEKKELSEDLCNANLNSSEIMKAGQRLAEIVLLIDSNTERWLELSELN
ncbi:MAG: ABC-F family ATP-binding cassette domain-containing protein [Flavobacteriia bacterium]|nr:ABC-F family ATP-binding cassette domain-containing protein [Flavobacteriia bacterium]